MGYIVEREIISGLFSRALQTTSLIVAHESGNANNVGPNSLDREISYMEKNHKRAFVSHWVGGGGRVVQLAPVGKEQWGAGSVANKHAYAQVELARTNVKATFDKDYAVYIELLRDLADEAGIPKTLNTGSKNTDKGIKTHHWVSVNLGNTTHVDPDAYLASWGISIAQFRKDIENGIGKKVVSTPKVDPDTSIHTVVSGDTLWDIAQEYGTKVTSIKAINGMKSDLIHIGDKLKVQDDESEAVTPKASTVFKVGQKVTISKSAKNYSTGQSIAPSVKGNTYTILQVGTGKLLLKEIISWVRTSDIVSETVVPPSMWESKLPNTSYYIKSPYFAGSSVLAVQEGLSKLYFYPNKGEDENGCDGVYGGDTEYAVLRYQSTKSGLKADGKYGPKTREKMLEDLK